MNKHSFQLKVLVMLNKLSLCGKWKELKFGLKLFNKILTRHYINFYWKLIFQIASMNFAKSIETLPQFIDCLHAMHLKNKNEIVYSIVLLMFSKDRFELATELLQMYHLTNSSIEPDVNLLISLLNADLDYIKWKEAIKDESNKDENQYIAEKCCFQLQMLVESLDVADFQIKKLSEIYIHYNKLNELHEILETYSNRHIDYLNAQKYLFEFEISHLNKLSLTSFQKIVKLCQSDSCILKYCKYFKDFTLAIDCLFDMLDYNQWRYDKSCWNYFNKVLLRADQKDDVRECINENWKLRESYWRPYHFSTLTNKYKAVDEHRLSVGIILLGANDSFVKSLANVCNLNLYQFSKEININNWLNETF